MLARVPLPRKTPTPAKRATRWRSAAHLAGVGQRPDDWRTVSLCRFHHQQQHNVGERTFWAGLDVERLIADFIATSPKRQEIERVQRERAHG